jgi:hypothetical protein
VKNPDFTPKNLFFSNFRGGARAGGAPPPLDPPLYSATLSEKGQDFESWIRPWNRKFEIRKKIKYIIISNLNVQSGWYTQYIIELFGELLCNDLNIQTDSMW